VQESEVSHLVAEAARHLGEGNAEAAVAALSAAGADDATSLPLQFMTALAAWYLGDVAAALRLSQSCFEREPGNGTLAEVLASLYAQSGNLIDSLYYGKLATALKPDPRLAAWLPPGFPSFGAAFLSIQEKPLLAQARMLLASGKLTAALDRARQHVGVAPEDEEGRLFYGAALLRAGSAGLAAETLQPLAAAGVIAPKAASLLGRALADIGDAAAARRWHDEACAAAPDDAEITAARIADAPWLGDDQAAAAADWAARFAKPGKGRRQRQAGDKLVIGYLVSHFADRKDAAAVAAVARAHKRPGVSVIGYGAGAQSWDENASLRGAFDKWRDISGFDPATLARTLSVDRLDVVIDVGGFAAPGNLRALARVDTALRAAWLCDPAGLERIVYDAVIASGGERRSSAIELWRPACGHYPLLRDWTRQRERSSDIICRFGSDARLCQIDAQTTRLWRSVLTAVPQSVLLLRANDMAPGPNIGRLIERFGADLAARIDVVDAASPDDFYRQVDIALAPLRGVSPRLAGEALACGAPVVALDDAGAWSAYPALLRALGLGELVATTAEDYVALAGALAQSPERRSMAAALAAAVADRGESIAAEIAAAIEQAARTSLSKAAA
jgi:hypothetical protein